MQALFQGLYWAANRTDSAVLMELVFQRRAINNCRLCNFCDSDKMRQSGRLNGLQIYQVTGGRFHVNCEKRWLR